MFQRRHVGQIIGGDGVAGGFSQRVFDSSSRVVILDFHNPLAICFGCCRHGGKVEGFRMSIPENIHGHDEKGMRGRIPKTSTGIGRDGAVVIKFNDGVFFAVQLAAPLQNAAREKNHLAKSVGVIGFELNGDDFGTSRVLRQ